ncbi:apoptosis-enhancing nuclease isoform X1 [Canis lupus familiaris]|uniref:apoptosis-enhancing nuclease isoform X1 n=1 Tax=Canis lupus familiaris TaxID=9615 RepID=UPI0015F1A1D5|nr:apoptosis-enhancing nuclease isoform X1 [Canis lupus familiaris]
MAVGMAGVGGQAWHSTFDTDVLTALGETPNLDPRSIFIHLPFCGQGGGDLVPGHLGFRARAPGRQPTAAYCLPHLPAERRPAGRSPHQATPAPRCELIGMVPREGPESAQCPCPSLASLNAKDVLRRKHKRKSRQHQRFMARKALLQEQGLLSMPPKLGPSPLPMPSEALPGTEATSSGMQRLRNEPGGASWSRKPTPRESAGPRPSKCVAIDCEMVGTGPRGRVSELARCSVVSYHGDVLYDKYIRPEMPIVDYRTRWSGVTRQHMRKAIPFQVAQKEILKLLKGKVVVGHALHNDFQALKYVHPRSQTRDTTYVPNLLHQPGLHTRTRVSLKDLALQLLHKKIQAGQHGHSSVEDATTAMELYRLVEVQWEQQQASSLPPRPEDREPDSSTDMEQYMEDQYWPEDLAQGTRGETEAQDRRE